MKSFFGKKDIKKVFDGERQAAVVFDAQYNILYANDAAKNALPRLDGGLAREYLRAAELMGLPKRARVRVTPVNADFSEGEMGVFFALEEGNTLLVLTSGAARELSSVGSVPFSDIHTDALRSNLHGILLALNSLVRDAEDDALFELQKGRRLCYESLRSLVNYTQVRRYLSGQSELQRKNCDLRGLLTALCEAARVVCPDAPAISFSGCELRCSLDPELIAHAVMNLLSNAMLFTRDGNEIDVSLKRVGGNAVITVEDRGLGIKPELIGKAQDAFFSADPYNDGEHSKREGLGLTVAYAAARLHGGTLLISSVFGEGTQVSLSLPARECDSERVETFRAADYVADSFSPVYVGLTPLCKLKY